MFFHCNSTVDSPYGSRTGSMLFAAIVQWRRNASTTNALQCVSDVSIRLILISDRRNNN